MYVHEIYKRLSQRHTVTVMTGSWPGASAGAVIEGVRYVHAGPPLNRIASRLCYSFRAALVTMSNRYDLVVDSISPFCPTFAGALTRRPCIADIGLDPFDAARKYRAIQSLILKCLSQNLRRHHNFIVLSPSLGTSIRKKVSEDALIRIIPPGVDTHLFEVKPCEHPFLLFLGRLDINHKGLDCLVKAYSLLRKERPGIRLVVAGTGPDEAKLRRMIADENIGDFVYFAGWVTGGRKTDLLRKCLAVCMPSRREGWPLVASEAAACSKPVVGFDVTGLRDAVRNGETGLLVRQEDIQALSQAMRRIVDDDSLRFTLGHKARKWALNFTWEKTAQAYETFYKEVLASES